MSYEQPTYEELVRDALLGLIQDLSEECWCAHWMHNLEFTLWKAVVTERMGSCLGMRDCDLTRLKSLHELSGGWWIWPEGEDHPRFLSTEEWLTAYAKHDAGPKA